MDNRIPGLVFGIFLLVVGSFMLAAQRKAARKLQSEPLSKQDRQFFTNRVRRRSQVAGMILIIGIMIPVGDSLIPWDRALGTFAVYWLIVIGLALWTMLLAVGDIAATSAHTSVELNELQRRRLELENAAQKLRQARQNGSPDHEQ